MKLIGSSSSPYVRKVRIVMAEKKLDYDFVTEDVWSADTTITQSNPLGKVPCLIMEAGEALFDSRVIVEYLDTLSPVGKLIPSTGRDRAEVKTWEALADGLMDAAILARLDVLTAMAKALGDKPYCSGIHLSRSDIAVGCALAYLDFRFPNVAWRDTHPVLARLQDKLAQRQSFIDTFPIA